MQLLAKTFKGLEDVLAQELTELRKEGDRTPVIMLTAKAEVE